MFNIKKYKDKKFHQDEAVHKKIEALFLVYDKRVYDNNLKYRSKIRLLNIYIKKLIQHEEYEVVQAFIERKFRKYKKYRMERRKKISYILRYRVFRSKASKYLRNLFKS